MKTLDQMVLNLIPLPFRNQVSFIHLPSTGMESFNDNTSRLIGICSDQKPAMVVRSAMNLNIKHICQSNGMFFPEEVSAAAHMVAHPQNFIDYPLSTIFPQSEMNLASEKKMRSFSRAFTCSEEKGNVLQEFHLWLNDKIKQQSLITEITNIADELFMNAVYNAPMLHRGSVENFRITNHLNNQTKDSLLFAHIQSDRLIIGCEDNYGTLRINKIMDRLKKCFEQGVGESINWSQGGGAGIGSYMVFNSSSSYYLGVQKGVKTVVCCKVPLGMSHRRREMEPKNLHLIEI